jgi:hypothetical protein
MMMSFVDFCITHFDWIIRQTNMCRNQSNSISCVAVSVHESGQGLSTKELNVYRLWVREDGVILVGIRKCSTGPQQNSKYWPCSTCIGATIVHRDTNTIQLFPQRI